MSVGETALVWSHAKYAHGPGQRKHGEEEYELPPNSNILYQITVRAVLKSNHRLIDEIAIALSKKNIGNDIFAHEWNPYGMARAKQQYKRAGELMEHLLQTAPWKDTDDEDKDTLSLQQTARDIMIDSFNNLAALYLRNKEYKLSKEAAVKVLERDPDNFKALIRAAKAALLDPASEFEEVQAALEAAAARTDHASDVDLLKLRDEFVRRKRAYKQKSKAMFSNKKTKKFESSIKTISEEEKEDRDESNHDDDEDEDQQTTLQTANEPEAGKAVVTAATTSNSSRWMDWRTWDWKHKILPYGFQLLLTCVMYWY